MMKRKIGAWLLAVGGMVMMLVGGATPVAATSGAAVMGTIEGAVSGSCGSATLLGFRPWYQDLCDGSNDIVSPGEDWDDDKKEGWIVQFVWTVILNILFDLFLATGYLSLGFVIWGGYLYIMSQGDPGKVAKGKRTLIAAIIGTIITMSASVIVNTATVALQIDKNGDWNQTTDATAQLGNAFTWAYTVAGIVAVVFIIKGGLDYLLAQGDPGKVRSATQAILYAVVGLVIVLLAAMITTFIISVTGGAVVDASSTEEVTMLITGGLWG